MAAIRIQLSLWDRTVIGAWLARSIDLKDGRVVDLGGEDTGGVRRCPITEMAAVQVGTGHEFTHPGSCRQGLEVGD